MAGRFNPVPPGWDQCPEIGMPAQEYPLIPMKVRAHHQQQLGRMLALGARQHEQWRVLTFVLVCCCCCCLLPQVPLGPNYRVPHMLQLTHGHWTPEAALTRAHELVTALVSSKLGMVAPLAMLAGRHAVLLQRMLAPAAAAPPTAVCVAEVCLLAS